MANSGYPKLRIGARVRYARRLRGLTLRELAEAVGCSESLLSRLENDRAHPSLQMLHRIMGELGKSIEFLLSQPEETGSIVVRAEDRQLLPMGSSGVRGTEGVQIESVIPHTGRLLAGSIHVVAPGGDSGGQITHEGEEFGNILEGEIELTVDSEVYHLKQGDSFFFQSDRPHGYRNPGNKTTRILWINTPPTF